MNHLGKRVSLVLVVGTLAGCVSAPPARKLSEAQAVRETSRLTLPSIPAEACAGSKPMTVHFYDVKQGLAALVELPDGRLVLVDTGDSPHRPKCEECAAAHAHLMDALARDVGDRPISLLWVTHQHSDHMGGAEDVLGRFKVQLYVDNGRDLQKPTIQRTHEAAEGAHVPIQVVDPEHRDPPLAGTATVRLTPIVPAFWPPACATNPNACSIGLRIDDCASSVLFTGDAEGEAEASWDLGGPVTLLQVGHHGSDTSSSAAFLARAQPKAAVISSGKKGDGLNEGYCHPRQSTVDRLDAVLGHVGNRRLPVFDASVRCKDATDFQWHDVPISDALYATPIDGDVSLSTTGDGVFKRVTAPVAAAAVPATFLAATGGGGPYLWRSPVPSR